MLEDATPMAARMYKLLETVSAKKMCNVLRYTFVAPELQGGVADPALFSRTSLTS
jgi:hypothetical protein